MKRRLEIARGLMHHPEVLFLDEPTLGLDPQTRRSIWEHILRLNQEKKVTVILTTHYTEEADYLCNRILIIDYGPMFVLGVMLCLVAVQVFTTGIVCEYLIRIYYSGSARPYRVAETTFENHSL